MSVQGAEGLRQYLGRKEDGPNSVGIVAKSQEPAGWWTASGRENCAKRTPLRSGNFLPPATLDSRLIQSPRNRPGSLLNSQPRRHPSLPGTSQAPSSTPRSPPTCRPAAAAPPSAP